MDFEEAQTGLFFENGAVVLGFEAETGAMPGSIRMGKGGHEIRSQPRQAGRLTGSSEPGPSGVSVETQVPLGTSFQALP